MRLFLTFLIISFLSGNSYSQSLESDTIDIVHYDLNLHLVHLSTRQIHGKATLTITPRVANLNRLKLDLLALTVDSVKVNQQPQTWLYNDTLLTINLSSIFQPSDTLTAEIFYHGQPVIDPSGWGGFYFSNDSLYAFNLGVGFDDNPHNYGRVFYPCLDDFHDRATYDFFIKTKIDKMAVCNGSLENVQVDTIANTKQFHWKMTNTIPSYLVGLAVGPYQVVADTFNGILGAIPIAIYVPSNKVTAAQNSFARLKQILSAYQWAYGPYRWQRVGYVGVPFGSGAMEHATNIALGLGFIDGTNSYESLIAHELSHHWFGDLVTTNSAPEMWINEGWAVYSESIYKEILDGKAVADAERRALLKNVIQRAHLDDGGYWSLDNLPHLVTYGTTAYDKGATVAHSLRGYLGDTVFFNTIRAYFAQNAYSHISNEGFRDFITSQSGINMMDFFDGWVFQPGFTHFSADSFKTTQMGTDFLSTVWMKQKLSNKNNPVNSNRVWVRFADDNWNFADRMMEFSGFTGSDTAHLSFNPTMVFVDPNAFLSDATTDYYEVVYDAALHNFSDAYFKADVQQITDSALLFVTHHWVEPDTDGTNLTGLHISKSRYWTVDGIFPQGFNLTGQFFYSKYSELDDEIILNSFDSLVILYRPSAGHPWQSVPFTKQGMWATGWIHVPNLQKGQYAIAMWEAQYAGWAKTHQNAPDLLIFPNPSSSDFSINIASSSSWTMQILDVNGRLVYSHEGKGSTTLRIADEVIPSAGVYQIVLKDFHSSAIISKRMVKINE
ncbi:MAG: T9SS type A sorting domain-containing protein [Bacteroidales bacterium]|nr:T9SS type A sorting domain-containing protein [Bacteroidales bacterium]